MKNLKVWDYKLPKNWEPENDFEWQWYLIRKINYGDFKGLKIALIKKHWRKIKKYLTSSKRLLPENFFKYEKILK
jgi:fibronectin type 3 domain-containing protein